MQTRDFIQTRIIMLGLFVATLLILWTGFATPTHASTTSQFINMSSSVSFVGQTAPITVNVRTGPGTSYSIVGTMSPNTTITFSYLDYGDLVTDYWTNYPDPRWYGYVASDGNVYWIASGLVYGNPPSSQLGNADRAIAWAIDQQGSQNWNGYCELFVENAYGTSGQNPTAQAAYNNAVYSNTLNTPGSTSPDIGALVWFAPNAGNGGYGHVGIYIGQNQFISATDFGVEINDLSSWSYYVAPFEGWADAPATWPGSN